MTIALDRLAFGFGMLAAAFSACGGSGPSRGEVVSPGQPPEDERQSRCDGDLNSATFWTLARGHGTSTEPRSTLRALADASDAVIIGRMQRVTATRYKRPLTFVTVEVSVVDSIRGELPLTASLEFALMIDSPEASRKETVSDLARGLPTSPMLFFLHQKSSPGEPPAFRLTDNVGLLCVEQGKIEAPFAPPPLSENLPELTTLEAAASMIRELDSQGQAEP